MHAFSDPAANVCSDDGDWGFFGEGGRLAFFDFQLINAVSSGGSTLNAPNEYSLPPELKTVQIGGLGVRPSEMIPHPDLDLSDDADFGDLANTLTPGPGDENDIIFIAGGRLGLWAMEAHPHPLYTTNRAVRIDDSGNLNVATQQSERYCNGLEIVTIGSDRYLVALHAKARSNRVRFYKLDRIASVFANAGPDGLGGEIVADKQVRVKEHPMAPLEANYDPNDPTPCLSEPYALDIAVHQLAADRGNIYVAVSGHGLARVVATPTAQGGVSTAVQWGPMFGTDNPGSYDDATGGGNNADGFLAKRYRNMDWVALDRSQDFDKVTRSDPPQFVDVAVHNLGAACKVYAAVDHLGWVRFDVPVSSAWAYDMPIDRHEGEDVAIGTATDLISDTAWTRAGQSVRTTQWDPALVSDFPLSDPAPASGNPRGGINYCHEVDIIEVEVANGAGTVLEPVLAAQYRIRPWFAEGRSPRFGGFTYNKNNQNYFGGIEQLAWFKLQFGARDIHGRCAFHRVADIDLVPSGSPYSWDGYVPSGGEDTYFPKVHTAAATGAIGTIQFVHGRSDYTDAGITALEPTHPELKLGGCLTFFDLGDGSYQAAPGVGLDRNAPVHVRLVGDRVARHHFYMGPSIIDSDLMLTSFSDNAPFGKQDGVLYSPYDAGANKWSLSALDTVHDKRAQAGAVAEVLSQWIRNGDMWTWGSDPGETNTNWSLRELIYTAGTGTTLPALVSGMRQVGMVMKVAAWTLKTPKDRWEASEGLRRPEHLGGSIHPDYDAYTSAIASQQDLLAETFVFASAGSTPDGVQMIARNLLMPHVEGLDPGSVDFPDPRDLLLLSQNPWWTVQFDTHPEWSNFPAIRFHNSDDVVVYDLDPITNPTSYRVSNELWQQAQNWWRPLAGTTPAQYNVLPLQTSAGACRTYPSRLLKLRRTAADLQPTDWVALVPCSHAVAPPTAYQAGLNPPPSGVIGLLTPPIDPDFVPDPVWVTNYDHGFLQVFDISDPWTIVNESKISVTDSTGTQDVIRPYRSGMDPLILPTKGGAAFRVDTAEFSPQGAGGPVVTLAFVADFIGRVEVFDLTDVLYRPQVGQMDPIASWVAPLSVMDAIPNNVRAIAVDRVADGAAVVYVGVSRVGIISIPFELGTGFIAGDTKRVKTPGEVWGLEIREDDADPARRTLLVADSYGGNRVYSLGSIYDQPASGQQ